MRTRFLTYFIGFALLFGCASPPEEPAVDLAAERASLMAADPAWFQTLPDVDVFVAAMASDGRFLPPGAPLAVGHEAIHGVVSHLTGLPGFALNWKATGAEVAENADLGYTIGTYELKMDDADGNPTTTVGKYVTVWEKQADGGWKVPSTVSTPTAHRQAPSRTAV